MSRCDRRSRSSRSCWSTSAVMVSSPLAIAVSIWASNSAHPERKPVHSLARSAVNMSCSRADSDLSRPAALSVNTSPPPRCANWTTRATPSAKTGTSGIAHTPCPICNAPPRRSSRHVATRCREGTAGIRTTKISHRTKRHARNHKQECNGCFFWRCPTGDFGRSPAQSVPRAGSWRTHVHVRPHLGLSRRRHRRGRYGRSCRR